MPSLKVLPRTDDCTVLAAVAGDTAAFAELVDRHRRELIAHCYRILRSFEEAEDIAQEAFLRAWSSRESFRGPSFRGWLYRIATNASLSALENRAARERIAPGLERAWMPPEMLEAVSGGEPGPEAKVIERETVELALLMAVRRLPPKQRAVLFLFDVLDWSAKDTAELLETSVPSVTSALQRARATLRSSFARGEHARPTNGERELLARLLDATERRDARALADIAATETDMAA